MKYRFKIEETNRQYIIDLYNRLSGILGSTETYDFNFRATPASYLELVSMLTDIEGQEIWSSGNISNTGPDFISRYKLLPDDGIRYVSLVQDEDDPTQDGYGLMALLNVTGTTGEAEIRLSDYRIYKLPEASQHKLRIKACDYFNYCFKTLGIQADAAMVSGSISITNDDTGTGAHRIKEISTGEHGSNSITFVSEEGSVSTSAEIFKRVTSYEKLDCQPCSYTICGKTGAFTATIQCLAGSEMNVTSTPLGPLIKGNSSVINALSEIPVFKGFVTLARPYYFENRRPAEICLRLIEDKLEIYIEADMSSSVCNDFLKMVSAKLDKKMVFDSAYVF